MDSHTILIVEDEPVTRDVLIQVVENHPQLTLLAAVSNIAEAETMLERKPDIVLVDIGLPDGNGIDLIRRIKQQHPEGAVMVVSGFGDEEHVLKAIEAGATGYILKDDSLAKVGPHILQLIKGESPISPGIARYLLKRFQKPLQQVTDESQPTLTKREKSVLTLIAKGYSRQEVAETLNVSQHTVTTHIKHIYRKLSVHSRTEAVFEAYQMGLIKPYH
ncbi:MAG: response regulator transcription factor [Mariprofundaceae bacterium]|nr:response regulator transcription factor [Mariprofundaceae bacterium]